ncbi:MAG: hypothetical protein MUP47_04560 [Phycisphaerae bacterium]|nr:hypothetical protein [Phycisphaerae bacterium]
MIAVRGGRLTAAALALAACLGVSGCGALRYAGYLAAPELPRKNVPAEFTGLDGHRVAIVIFADPRVQYEYPQARLTVASVIRAEMNARLKNVSVTDVAKVCQYQNDHVNWETLEKSELAKQFGVDYILYVTLVEYTTREVGSIDLYRGRITAECGLYQAGVSDPEGRVWHCDRLAVLYPETAPAGVPGESDRAVREEAERLLADALVKKFYDHKEAVK